MKRAVDLGAALPSAGRRCRKRLHQGLGWDIPPMSVHQKRLQSRNQTAARICALGDARSLRGWRTCGRCAPGRGRWRCRSCGSRGAVRGRSSISARRTTRPKLAVLRAAAVERIAAGQALLDLGVGAVAGAGRLEIGPWGGRCRRRGSVGDCRLEGGQLWDALCRAYDMLV